MGPIKDQYQLVMDAVFGFSFSGQIRSPFDAIITSMATCGVDVVSIDVPSGWHVEDGPGDVNGLMPTMLVSLTAPKCMLR